MRAEMEANDSIDSDYLIDIVEARIKAWRLREEHGAQGQVS